MESPPHRMILTANHPILSYIEIAIKLSLLKPKILIIMVDSVDDFSLSRASFGRKLDMFIWVHRFLEDLEVLYLVTEFLEVEDIVRFSMTCKDVQSIVDIPYIEIRILRCRLSIYENRRDIRNADRVNEFAQNEPQRANISAIKIGIAENANGIHLKFAELVKAKRNIREYR